MDLRLALPKEEKPGKVMFPPTENVLATFTE